MLGFVSIFVKQSEIQIVAQNKRIKMKYELKEEILHSIKTDPILFGKVAFTVNVIPGSLTRLLLQKHKKLVHPNVLAVISKHLGIKDSNLLCTVQEKSGKSQKQTVNG